MPIMNIESLKSRMQTLSNRYDELTQTIQSQINEQRQLEGAFKELELLVAKLESEDSSNKTGEDKVAEKAVKDNGQPVNTTNSPAIRGK